MTESAEAERQLTQTMAAAMSVALNIATQAHHRLAERARQERLETEEAQRDLADKLAAERETAAVLWRQVDDPDWIRTRPDEVAEAWASARTWEHLDPRAAEARAKFDFLIDNIYGAQHPLVDIARQDGDHEALASLLGRAVEHNPGPNAPLQLYETVPENERQQWLERQVWGPESDENTRIARSAELDALQQGLPVAVLREMPEESRNAWIALEQQSPEQRREWQRAWLLREAWGPDTPEDVRLQRQAQLDALAQGYSVPMIGAEWQAWLDQQHTPAPESSTRDDTDTPRSAESEHEQGQSSVRQETDAERQQRAAAAVREAWPEEVADQVTNRDAFGAFSYRLSQLEARGYSMRESLDMVPSERMIGTDYWGQPVRNPAAFAEWHVEQLVDSLPERDTAVDGLGRLEQYLADHADQTPSQRAEQPEHGFTNETTLEASASGHTEPEPTKSHQVASTQPEQRGAYDTAPNPGIRLAGESHPTPLNRALSQRQQSPKNTGATRHPQRGQDHERGR